MNYSSPSTSNDTRLGLTSDPRTTISTSKTIHPKAKRLKTITNELSASMNIPDTANHVISPSDDGWRLAIVDQGQVVDGLSQGDDATLDYRKD